MADSDVAQWNRLLEAAEHDIEEHGTKYAAVKIAELEAEKASLLARIAALSASEGNYPATEDERLEMPAWLRTGSAGEGAVLPVPADEEIEQVIRAFQYVARQNSRADNRAWAKGCIERWREYRALLNGEGV